MTPEEVPDELLKLAGRYLDEEPEELLAAVLSRWEEIRPQVCPYDCDGCHDEECPCERLGCAGFVERECRPVPCPPLEDVRLEVLETWGPATRVTGFVTDEHAEWP